MAQATALILDSTIATSSTASQYVRNPRTSGLPLNATSTQMDPQPTWADHYRVFYFALGP